MTSTACLPAWRTNPSACRVRRASAAPLYVRAGQAPHAARLHLPLPPLRQPAVLLRCSRQPSARLPPCPPAELVRLQPALGPLFLESNDAGEHLAMHPGQYVRRQYWPLMVRGLTGRKAGQPGACGRRGGMHRPAQLQSLPPGTSLPLPLKLRSNSLRLPLRLQADSRLAGFLHGAIFYPKQVDALAGARLLWLQRLRPPHPALGAC